MECRNCKTATNHNSLFCNLCGEKIPFKRLTLKTIITSAFNQILDIDNKLIRTFIKLFTHPELVIDNYNQGFRKKYVNLMSYLGLAISLLGLQLFTLKKFYPELLSLNFKPANNSAFNIEEFFDVFYDYQGLFTLALLPIYALASWIVFIDSKKYNLAEHFVINTYATSQIFIAWFFVSIVILPFGVNYNLLTQLLVLPQLIYMIFVFKKLYDFSLMSIILRTIAYTLLTFIALILITIFVFIVYGIYMGVTGQITK